MQLCLSVPFLYLLCRSRQCDPVKVRADVVDVAVWYEAQANCFRPNGTS